MMSSVIGVCALPPPPQVYQVLSCRKAHCPYPPPQPRLATPLATPRLNIKTRTPDLWVEQDGLSPPRLFSSRESNAAAN